MAKNLDVKGLEELVKAMEDAPQIARPILENGMGKSLLLIEGIVKPYPEQPSRTRAKTFNTYVRGRGRYPRSAFVEGQFSTKAARGMVKEGKVKLVSERLGSKWTHQVDFKEGVVEGVIGNTASYSMVVQGDPETEQAGFHAVTGWPTLPGAVDQSEPDVNAIFDQSAGEVVQALGREP